MERVGLMGRNQEVCILTGGRVALKRRRKTVSSARSLQLEHRQPREENTGPQRIQTATWGLLARERSRRSNTGELTL